MEQNKIKIINLKPEDFVNYKKPSLFIGIGQCNWKCCLEAGIDKSVCQNSELGTTPQFYVDIDDIINMYVQNSLTESLVIGGLEPLFNNNTFNDVYNLIKQFRNHSQDDIVIYTGYYPHEVLQYIYRLIPFDNIIFKFGRYKPNTPSIFDTTLGVTLASDNQYGVKFNNDIEIRKEIITGLLETKGYCPCMIKQNHNTLCSCLAFRKQKTGICHCGLWEKS